MNGAEVAEVLVVRAVEEWDAEAIPPEQLIGATVELIPEGLDPLDSAGPTWLRRPGELLIEFLESAWSVHDGLLRLNQDNPLRGLASVNRLCRTSQILIDVREAAEMLC